DDSSCSVKNNVETVNGALVLSVRQGDYFTRRFTGAKVVTTNTFDSIGREARIDIRAALPVGTQLYASIFAVNKKEFNPIQFSYGWLEIVTNYQRPLIVHGAHYRRPTALGQMHR